MMNGFIGKLFQKAHTKTVLLNVRYKNAIITYIILIILPILRDTFRQKSCSVFVFMMGQCGSA